MDEVSPPQERQISDLMESDLSTKRVMTPTYWDSVTEFHRGYLGPLKIPNLTHFSLRKI